MRAPTILVDAMLSPNLVSCLKALGYTKSFHVKDLYPIDAPDDLLKKFVEENYAILITKDRKHFNSLKRGCVILVDNGGFERELKETLKALSKLGYPPRIEWANPTPQSHNST